MRTQCADCGLHHAREDGTVIRPCSGPRLREAFRGVALTEADERILRWLAGQDATTVDTVVSLADRLRAYAALGEEARSDG